MTDMNHLFLIGRIVRDVGTDERSFGYVGQTARANVSIAVNRSKKDGDQWVDEVSYFDIQIWGKTAENLRPYLIKGKQIAVEGFLKQDRWEKDGKNYSKIIITAVSVQLLGGKSDGESGNESGQKQSFRPKTSNSAAYQPPQEQQEEGFPEDIPF